MALPSTRIPTHLLTDGFKKENEVNIKKNYRFRADSP